MQTVLKSVYINDKKKDGSPYINKKGQPFKMAMIETAEGVKASLYLDEKFGAKDEATISTWKSGDTVDIVIEEAGDFTNFKIPTKTDLLEEKVNDIDRRLSALENKGLPENVSVGK